MNAILAAMKGGAYSEEILADAERNSVFGGLIRPADGRGESVVIPKAGDDKAALEALADGKVSVVFTESEALVSTATAEAAEKAFAERFGEPIKRAAKDNPVDVVLSKHPEPETAGLLEALNVETEAVSLVLSNGATLELPAVPPTVEHFPDGTSVYNLPEPKLATIVYGSTAVAAGLQAYVEVQYADGSVEVLNTDGAVASSSQAAAIKARSFARKHAEALAEQGYSISFKTLGKAPGKSAVGAERVIEKTVETPAAPTPEAQIDEPPVDAQLDTLSGKLADLEVESMPENFIPPAVAPEEIFGQERAIRAIMAAVRRNMPVKLTGHKGTGKTGLIERLAYDNRKTFVRLSTNGQTGVEEFVGRWILKQENGASVCEWLDGVLVTCMRNGYWLLIDELNAALPEVCFILQSALDSRRLALVEKDGSVVNAHPDFRCFAAVNPSDEYAGTKALNPSLEDRFRCEILVDYPAPEVEQRILCDRTGVSAYDAGLMVEFAGRIRKAKHDGITVQTVSTRQLLAWAELSVELQDRALAFEFTVLNKALDDFDFFAKTIEKVDSAARTADNAIGKKQRGLFLDELRAAAAEVKAGGILLEDAKLEAKLAVDNARFDADRILEDARGEARILHDIAKAQAEQLKKTADEYAARVSAQIETKKENLKAELMAKFAEMVASGIENGEVSPE